MATEERVIPLSGAVNFRDLGGYPTSDGRRTRWGRLFRSDSLHGLTASDVDLLASMGLASVIDLRTSSESDRMGRGLLREEPVAFCRLSVLGDEIAAGSGEDVAVPAPAGDDLSERYLWYLEAGRPALTRALTLLGEPDSLPLVFHCAAGKDRTGVLAALVLEIVGVAPETIVADYMVTGDRMALILDRFRSDPVQAARMAEVPPSEITVEAATMERFLERLEHRFGGARAWAQVAGVPGERLDRIVELLVEPSGDGR